MVLRDHLMVLAFRLYGITLQQSFRYYRLYPSDSRLLKGLVRVSLSLVLVEELTSPPDYRRLVSHPLC